MTSILDNIYAAKRVEVRAQRSVVSPMAIVAEANRAPNPRDFVAALRARRPAIIAELKRASPSKGDIMPGLDPANVAREYVAGGAAAISVLTDVHFKGTLEDLRAVRAAGEQGDARIRRATRRLRCALCSGSRGGTDPGPRRARQRRGR